MLINTCNVLHFNKPNHRQSLCNNHLISDEIGCKKKNHLNSCYKTTVDRAQWQGSVIGICPVCFTSEYLDDDINSQVFMKTLSRLLSVVDVAEQCSLEGLRMAFAISGNNLQQKL